MKPEEIEELSEAAKDAVDSFLSLSEMGRKLEFICGSIRGSVYWVGNVLRIDMNMKEAKR